MSTRLPPLKSLQAFDAAARHLSFKLAAEELHVTPTAISHQVKALEECLGHKLFNRLTRSLSLTKEGEVYAPLIHEGFSRLSEASEALHQSSATGELTVTTTTSFATKWLTPRLHRFSEEYPEITVRLDGSDSVVDFSRQNFDVAIRYGHGDYGDNYVAWVLEDKAAPVCAPDYLREKGLGTTAEDIARTSLIHYEWSGFNDTDPSWKRWFELHQVEPDDIPVSAVYTDEHLCIRAATDGHGVALIGLLAAADDLERGRLVIPNRSCLKNKGYFFVCPQLHAEDKKIAAFRDWLLKEADDFRDSPTGRMIEDLT